jgi:aminoglycoside phosphotransferase family enzyme/predicted kinase
VVFVLRPLNSTFAVSLPIFANSLAHEALCQIEDLTVARTASERLIEKLQQPGVLSVESSEVSIMHTHISWVLLAGPWAYKLKKPVNLAFLDFTSLDKRRTYCEEELRLNRRLAPDLYLDVIPITGTPEIPRLGGPPGRAIEYAVRMKRFPQEALLPCVLARSEIQPQHMDGLARAIADFHQQVSRAPAQSAWGTPERVQAPPNNNLRYLAGLVAEAPCRAQLDRLKKWTDDEFLEHYADFATRRQEGFIRECHGDLHLGNMVLLDGKIRIFDCIEFNEDLRWIDVISDVAFAAMDLEHRGRPDFARRFLNAYLERTGDYGGLAVFPYYFVYRALVRALVDEIRSGQLQGDVNEAQRLNDEFHSFLDLAERWTQPRLPTLTITFGVTGSGKTTGTQPLIEREGAIRVRSDVERKRLLGLQPEERSGASVGESTYTREATDRTYHCLAEKATTVIRAGFPVIVDATFLAKRRRQRFHRLAEDLGVGFRITAFEADEATLRQRVEARQCEGKDASEATVAVLQDQLKALEPLGADERKYSVAVQSGPAPLR